MSAGEEEKFVMSQFQATKLENWEDQILNPSPRNDVIKQEVSQNSNLYGHGDEDFQAAPRSANWSQIMPVSSPTSCVTSFRNNSNNIFDFSYNKNQQPDQSSEVNFIFILCVLELFVFIYMYIYISS